MAAVSLWPGQTILARSGGGLAEKSASRLAQTPLLIPAMAAAHGLVVMGLMPCVVGDGRRQAACDAGALDVLWVGCGTDDSAMPGAKRLADLLTANGIDHAFEATGEE